MTLGQVMQAASAFTIVQGAFNWLVDNYPKLADWTASARRAASLMVSLDGLERAESGDGDEGVGRIEITRDGDDAAIRLQRSSGRARRRHRRARRHRDGDQARRARAGRRRIRNRQEHAGARDFRPMAVGQRPDRDSERRQADAAAAARPTSRSAAAPRGDLSRRCGQPRGRGNRRGVQARRPGAPRRALEDEAPWDQTLSGGEKQRLAFARIFLHNPDIIVLDEATSALDPESQDKLMELLRSSRRRPRWSASAIAPSSRRSTTARSCWSAGRAAPSLSATSSSCRGPRSGASCAGCCGGGNARSGVRGEASAGRHQTPSPSHPPPLKQAGQ